jgi:hypothetical protein
MAALTTSFWACQQVFQRAVGLVGIHGGRPYLVTTTVGAITTGCSLLLSHVLNNNKQHIFTFLETGANKQWPTTTIPSWSSIPTSSKKRCIRETSVGLLVYALLERGSFRTALPSSVIALGVFASAGNERWRSILTENPVATESQRRLIQKFGRRYGCHACGDRQLFNRNIFIADHMPPTKFANEGNAKWFRRWFNFKVGFELERCPYIMRRDKIS